MWGWGWLDTLSQDVRWGARTLRRTPVFTFAAVLTLALGIGVNTAIFTVVRAQLLRPLPYPDADRLVWVFQSSRTFMPGEPLEATEATVDAWRRQAHEIDSLATFVGTRRILTGLGEADEVSVAAVSPELFRLLGVSPWRGRLFSEAENRRGRDGVALLSHAFWQRRFGGDPSAVGREVRLGSRSFSIVGVLPPGVTFAPLDRPRFAWLAPRDTDAWVPVSVESSPAQATGRYYLGVIGRLAPRATPAQAQSELSRIAAAASNGRSGAIVAGLQQELVKKVRLPLLLITYGAGFVLLIACVNVAQLQLAKGMARGRELAIRVAVGAGRRRLVRQLLVESCILAGAGGILGVLVVVVSRGVISSIAGSEVPLAGAAVVDGWVLAFALGASAGSAVLFGLMPARQACRVDPLASLRDGGRGPAGSRRLTGGLVVAEISLALVLLACAGLMLTTVWRLQHVSTGFRPDRLLTFHVQLPRTLPGAPDRNVALIAGLLERVRSLPGVEAAEAVNTLPMGGAPTFAGVEIAGDPRSDDHPATAQYRVVTPGYFTAMGIPLRRGRVFTAADAGDTLRVAIVNERMERQFFHGNALGRYLTQGEPGPALIVGVVGDVRHASARSEPLPEVYHPMPQAGLSSPWLAVRFAGDAAAINRAVRRELAATEPAAAITQTKTMEQRQDEALGTSRFMVMLLVAFASLAQLLALVGVYGVVSYRVTRRRHEFGVRMALGAPRGNVLALVVGETFRLVTVAVAIGAAETVACSRLLSGYLFQVQPADPATLSAAAALMAVTALAAAYIPARRAERSDPLAVLRQE